MINIQSRSLDIMPDGVNSAEVPYANGNVGTNTPIGNMAWLNGQAADTKLPVNYWNWMLKQITKICLNISRYFTNLHTEVRNLILNTGPGILYPTNINALAENNDNQLIEAVNNKITSMRTSCIAGKAVGGTTLGTVTSSSGSGKVSVDQNTGVMTANGLGDVAAGFTSLPTNVQTVLASDKTMSGLMRVIFGMVYPVGSIYTSSTMSSAAQVQAAFGGTWVAYGQGRVLVGAGTGNDGITSKIFTIGSTGGYYTIKLTSAQLPAHAHTGSTNTTGGHTHGPVTFRILGTYTNTQLTHTDNGANCSGAFYNGGKGSNDGTTDHGGTSGIIGFDAHGPDIAGYTYSNWSGNTSWAGDHAHTVNVDDSSQARGSAHENTQPYVVVYMYRRIS